MAFQCNIVHCTVRLKMYRTQTTLVRSPFCLVGKEEASKYIILILKLKICDNEKFIGKN